MGILGMCRGDWFSLECERVKFCGLNFILLRLFASCTMFLNISYFFFSFLERVMKLLRLHRALRSYEERPRHAIE